MPWTRSGASVNPTRTKEKLGNNRVIEIGKSREDNEGRIFVKRKDDLTLQIDGPVTLLVHQSCLLTRCGSPALP